MKNKIITVLLLVAAGFGQDAQAMGGRAFFESLQKASSYFSLTKLGVVVAPLAYYVHKKENEDWFDDVVAESQEPKELTVEERIAFEKRFSLVKKQEVFFAEEKKSSDSPSIAVIYNSRGQTLVSVSPAYLKLPEQMKAGLRAHESAHVELAHRLEREKEKRIQEVATVGYFFLLSKSKKCFLALVPFVSSGYYFMPEYRSRLREKEADLHNKTPEELYGLLMYFYAWSVQSEEDTLFQKLKSTHPSHSERVTYLREAFKRQTRNPELRDIPQTVEALISALCVYLKQEEVDQFLKTEDFEQTWQALKITHTDHIKERIFFLWKEYIKRYSEMVKSLQMIGGGLLL